MPNNQDEDFYKKLFLEHFPKKDRPGAGSEPMRAPENITEAPPTIVGGAEITKDAPETPVREENTPSAQEPPIKSEVPPDTWEDVGQVANMFFNDAERREQEATDEAAKTALSDKVIFLRSVREAAEFAKDHEGFKDLLVRGLNSGTLTPEEFAALGQTLAGNNVIEASKETDAPPSAPSASEVLSPQGRSELLKEPEELVREEDEEPPPRTHEVSAELDLSKTEGAPAPELTLPVEPAPAEEVPVAAPEVAVEAPAKLDLSKIEYTFPPELKIDSTPAPVEETTEVAPIAPTAVTEAPAVESTEQATAETPAPSVPEEITPPLVAEIIPPETEPSVLPRETPTPESASASSIAPEASSTPPIEEEAHPAVEPPPSVTESATPPAPEATPVSEKKSIPIIDDAFKDRFGILEKDLFTIDGYNKLSEGQRRMVYTNLEQLSLGRVKETALEREHEEAAGKGLLKRIVHNTIKAYHIAEHETASAKELAQGGIEVHRGFLTELVLGAPKGPEARHPDDSSLAIDFVSSKSLHDLDPTKPVTERGDPLFDAGTRFNFKASDFAQIRQEWKFAGTGKQKQRFKETASAYEKARGAFANALMASVTDKNKIEQYLLDLDQKIKTQQFFNTHPEAEQEFNNILNRSKGALWKNFAKTTLTERGIISGAGLLNRTSAIYTATALGLGVIGTGGLGVLGAGVLGGVLAWRRGTQELALKAYGARHGVKGHTIKFKKQYEFAEGKIVHIKSLQIDPSVTVSLELKDQIREANSMDEGPEKDALLATLQNKAGGIANVSLKDEVSVEFGEKIYDLLHQKQLASLQKITEDVNKTKSNDARNKQMEKLEQMLKKVSIAKLTNAPVKITYKDKKGATGVLEAHKFQKGIETALKRINDSTLTPAKRMDAREGLARLLHYGQLLMEEGSIDYGAGHERIPTRLAFASALAEGLARVSEKNIAIALDEKILPKKTPEEIKERAASAAKAHEKATKRRHTKFLAIETVKGVGISVGAFIAGRLIRGLFVKGGIAAEYQSGKAVIKSIKSIFSKNQNEAAPDAVGGASPAEQNVGGKTEPRQPRTPAPDETLQKTRGPDRRNLDTRSIPTAGPKEETVTIAKLKESAGVETTGKGETVKIATLKEATPGAAEPQGPSRLEMKIGRRGPEGSIIDSFKHDPELAMKFGWDGKTDLSRWAGKRAHQLWLAHAREALAEPQTEIQMKKLGFTPDLKGYGEMMRQIKGGMVELDPQTGKVDLGDMEYFKAKAPRIAGEGAARESLFQPPGERGLSSAEFDAMRKEITQPFGEKIPQTELPAEALDPAMENLRGNVKYFFEPREGVYDTVWPKLKDIPIKKLADVIPGGKDALDYYQENGSLRIPLPRKQGGVVDIYGWHRADKMAQLGDFLRRINIKKYGNLALEEVLSIMNRKNVMPEFMK